MKKILRKIHKHANKKVHPALAISILTYAVFLIGYMPLISMAQGVTDLTPIVHQYKIAQSTEPAPALAPAPSLAPAAPEASVSPAPAPAAEQPAATTEQRVEVKTEASTETQLAPIQEPNKMENPAQAQQETVVKEFEEQTKVEFVDPRDVQNALGDIKRMQSDIKRFVKQLKKIPNSADDLNFANNLLAQLNEHYSAIKNPPADVSLREALQEFWEARMWEEVDNIRAKVEIPKELTNIAKDLKKLKKTITLKAYKNLGFNLDSMAESIAEMESAYNEAKSYYDQGNLEDAWSAMETFHSGMQPGEVMGVLNQTKEIKERTRLVKNQEIKDTINEVLSDVIESADAGEFRSANQALNEIRNELMKIMNKFAKQTSALDDKTKDKLDKLESMIQDKLSNNNNAPFQEKQ